MFQEFNVISNNFLEEEMKRLHQALDSENTYSQVAYNYNEEGNGSKITCEDSQSPKQSEGSQEEDQAFVPPSDLEIPDGIPLVGAKSIIDETKKNEDLL